MKISAELHDNLLTWLKANNIDANNIPPDACMTLNGDQLTTEMHVRDSDGHKTWAPGKDALARTVATFTVTVPPDDVAWWLRPRCPTCGR